MSENFILKSRTASVEIPLMSVGEFVWNRLQKLNPDLTCIIDAKSGTKLTVKELISQSHNVAIALLERGVTKSDRICCLSNNSIEYAVILFACYFLGITIVPISPTVAAYELNIEMQNMDSIVIFTSLSFVKHFDEIIKDFVNNNNEKLKIKSIVVMDGSYANYSTFEQLLAEGKNRTLKRVPHFDIDPKNDIFVILRSSGTTGPPKSPMTSHFAFVASLMCGRFKLNSVIALIFPFGHIGGTGCLPSMVSSGATVVLYQEYNEELLIKSVEKYKIDFLPIFPAFGQKLIDEEFVGKYDLSSIKVMLTGGAAFPGNIAKAIIDKYNVNFVESYGMTEFVPIAFDLSYDSPNTEFIPGNMGHITQNIELKIVDLNTGQTLGPNIDGEIYVRGPQMFSGYLNNSSATNDTIDSNGWLHTGDVGHYDQNERLFITDRIKELIKFGTFQVCPTEIEQFLLTHECVSEVAVIGIKHEIDTQWPRAYVKLKMGKSVTEEEIKNFVSESMGYTKQLRAGVVFVDEIKRTVIGKVDRKYYKQLVINEVIKTQQ